MITNLFRIFDPTTNYNLNINWICILLPLLIIPNLYWILPNPYYFLFHKISLTLYNEFKTILSHKTKHNFALIFTSIFIFIIFNNLLGLFPYIFTGTRHLTLNLTLALPIWLRLLIFGWVNKTNHIFRHLVPQGTPNLLIPFIICIETIRNIIRPITLTVRITANIIAGHLLLTLLGNLATNINYYFFPILLFVQLLLITLEIAVSIIQSYVFAILLTLYTREV